jgi:hypothetical protein
VEGDDCSSGIEISGGMCGITSAAAFCCRRIAIASYPAFAPATTDSVVLWVSPRARLSFHRLTGADCDIRIHGSDLIFDRTKEMASP